MVVGNNSTEGKARSPFRLLVGEAYGEKDNDTHGVRHAEGCFDLLFVKDSNETASEPETRGLKAHERAGDAEVHRIAELTVGHLVVHVGRTDGEGARCRADILLPEGGILNRHAQVGILNDDESPGLAILSRRGETAGLEDALDGLFGDGIGFELSSGYSRVDFRE